MNRRMQWLIIIYPYNGKSVRSYKVSCFNYPQWYDISTLESYFNARVEIKNLSAK